MFFVAGCGALLGWTIAVGCSWPEYAVTPLTLDGNFEETSDDTSIGDGSVGDAGGFESEPIDTGPYILADGRVCTGHDEDGDGVPDECDNCPNVANKSQAGGAIGDACAAGSSFIGSPSRLLFDPFTSLGSWKAFGSGSGVFELAPSGDAFNGGSTTSVTDAGPVLDFLVGSTGAGSSALVATTVMQVQEESNGSAGLLLRVSSDANKKFFICALSIANGFAAARAPDTGCNGGPCGPVAFPLVTDAGSTAAQFPIPSDIPHATGDSIGLRASVSAPTGDAGGSGEFECRVFNPKDPSTLTSKDAKYAVKVAVTSGKWLGAGEVGLYAQRSKASFSSIDVLRGP